MKSAGMLLLILAQAPLSIAMAQVGARVKLLPPRMTVSDSVARAACVVIPQPTPYVVPPLTHTCSVVAFDTLPRAAGKRWSYAVQRHVYVYDFSDSANKTGIDTLPEIETVLYSSAPSSRMLTAVLHAREDEEIIRSITPDLAARPGGALLGMQLCLNGTGGCWQEFLRYDGTAWRPIADPLIEIRSRVLQAFHGDSSHMTRSPRVDVHTLRGTADIADAGDANCCSSHRAEFELALDGNRFRIVRFRVVARDR